MVESTTSTLPPIGTRLSADAFLSLPETETRVQLIDGVLTMAPAPVPAHQKTVARLYRVVDDAKPNGEVVLSPIDVYLDDENVVQPDIFWVAEQGACVEYDTHYRGAPDLIIEVLSPGTAKHDRSDKFKLYERHGVREYWMVEPVAKFVEVWRLEDDRFVQQGAYEAGESFESTTLGVLITLAGIFD